jgi:4-carboxymuconolactone decarboxylase
MARLPLVTREELPPEKRYIFDLISARRGDIRNTVYPLHLTNPEAAEKIAELGAYLQFCPLAPIAAQLAILTTCKELDSQFIWAQRVPMALRDGVSKEAVDIIRNQLSLQELEPDQAALIQFARELIRSHAASDVSYEAVHRLLGSRGLIDYALLVGFYSLLILMTNALELKGPDSADIATR